MSEPIDESKWAWKTADSCLHTGSEHMIDPEDLVMASGREPTCGPHREGPQVAGGAWPRSCREVPPVRRSCAATS